MPATYTWAHENKEHMHWLNILFEKHLFENKEDLKVRSKLKLFIKCDVPDKISFENWEKKYNKLMEKEL